MKKKPNLRAEANRLLGCIGMDENSLFEEILSALEMAYVAGILSKKDDCEESRKANIYTF